jgi:hypothetical protein
MPEKKKTEKPPAGFRIQPDVLQCLDSIIGRMMSKHGGRVNRGDAMGAAILAMLSMSDPEQEDLIFGVARRQDPAFENDPRVVRVRSLMQRALRSP